VSGSIRRSGNTIGANVAVGAEIEVADRLFVELEMRYHYTTEVSVLTPLVGVSFQFVP
jgi:opacity protein-like surface antigen